MSCGILYRCTVVLTITLQEKAFVKKLTTILSRLAPIALVIAVGLGCNQLRSSEHAASNATTVASTTSPPATDIAGTYDISGTNENGAGAYRGTLLVAPRGDVYQFSWDTAGKKYDGVGVRSGNTVGVAFAEGRSGEGCGVVVYKVAPDGSLDGKAGYWGTNSSETETAVRTKGTELEGEYAIKGRNTAGKDYTGTLAVKRSGAGYTFSWQAGSAFDGFGIRQDDMVTVGIGGNKCGFVGYQLKSDGTLDGKWGGYGSRSVGTEIAKKKS